MATQAKPIGLSAGVQTSHRRIQDVLLSDTFGATMLSLVFGLIYWLTRTNYNTFDAVSYANQIGRVYATTGDPHWLFHPHHLLFNGFNYLLWRIARAMGYVGGPLIVIQRANAVFGAGGIGLFYLTLRRLMTRTHGLPGLTAAGLALSFGYWVCATDGRVNMPSLFFLLASFCNFCRTDGSLEKKAAAVTGTLAGVAALFHESAVLFLPVCLAGVVLMAGDKSSRTRNLIVCGLAWTATLAVPYLLVSTAVLHLHSWRAFHQWTTEYAELGWWWSFDIPHNLRLDLYAFRHAAFVEPPGKQGTFSLSQTAPLDARLLYFGALAGWLMAVYTFFAALPLLWRSHHRPVMIVCLLWITLYAAFFTVWCAGYFVFWVPVLVPTGLLLSLGMCHFRSGRWGRGVNWLLGLWIALFAVVNWTDSIKPHLHTDANPFQHIASDVKAHTRPGDLILMAGAGEQGECEVFVPYFADRDVVSLHTLLTRAHNDKTVAYGAALAQMRDAWAAGHTVYGFDELWHGSQAWNALQRRHPSVGPADLAGWAVTEPVPAWMDIHGRPVWRLMDRDTE